MRKCGASPPLCPRGWKLYLAAILLLTVYANAQFKIPKRSRRGIVPLLSQEKVNITKILNEIFERGYDKRVRPNYGGAPVEVGVTMFILSISQVSEVQMDFTLDFYFRQSWNDYRLDFKARPGFESLTVGAEVADRIWVPDTFFANEKSAYFHQATTPNTFLRILEGGEVFRSIRLTVTSSCPMDLRYFPMDRQVCTVEIESFGYPMKDIRYRWKENDSSVRMSQDVELPQFKVVGLQISSRVVNLTTGKYSRLVCEITFVRSMGYYLIQIYIPAGLIVIISWVSFWLHRNATPARVALGVTTVLTMTTLMSSTNAAMPKISYVKSIDVYLGTCFVMVFASLLEYATVGYLAKRISMRKTRTQLMARLAEQHRQRCPAATLPDPDPVLVPCHAPEVPLIKTADRQQRNQSQRPPYKPDRAWKNQEVRLKMYDPHHHQHRCYKPNLNSVPQQINGSNLQCDFEANYLHNTNKLFGVSPSDIDKYSRVVFPVCFVCFNLMYWIIYLYISDEPTGIISDV